MIDWYLILEMVQNVSIFAVAAYLTTRLPAIRKAISHSQYRSSDKIILAIVFGLFSAFGNWMGIPILGSMANTRIVGPIAGGLLGGPIVGIGAGIIGAIPRYFMGGFTMWAAVIANIIAGAVSGLVYKKIGPQNITLVVAAIVGFVGEGILKLLVLTLSDPFAAAWALEEAIAIPTMTVNSLAVVMFVYIVRDVLSEQIKMQALSAQQAIRVLHRASGFLHKGLNEETAQKVAQIIYNETKAAAIAVTDLEKVLAFVGEGADHHKSGRPILTAATKLMMKNRQTVICNTKEGIGCPEPKCNLSAVIDAPMIVSNEVVGSIKLYKSNRALLSTYDAELIQGIADFLSLQLAQKKLDEQQVVLLQTECQMLKAQINPHFFFNTLGTIQTLIPISPVKSMALIKDLAAFFRRTLNRSSESVSLREEIESVRNYVRIEKARFGDKITVIEKLPEHLLEHPVPLFSLQLLVENAIRHGVSLKKGQGTVQIVAWNNEDCLFIKVNDDGIGIPVERLEKLLQERINQTGGIGIGLLNIHRRIQKIYGNRFGLQIQSVQDKGTEVTICLPLKLEGE